MIKREMLKELKILLKEYPVVTILGPRQAGKTTLARSFLKGFEYVNLELPENRELAMLDPKAFLSNFKRPIIIDEIQRVPDLLSYIQVEIDESNLNGQFVLTGSHQLELHESIGQSLAGRTSILKLLPFSLSEIKTENNNLDFYDISIKGFLPRVHDKNQRPQVAYSNYFQTYVERDVRQLINIQDLSLFEKFIKLLAGRVGQVINLTSLSNDVGVTHKTIQEWLSILEASFIIYKLPPFYNNFGKRAIKSPKYYFMETGFLCFLLGIENKTQLKRDPLIGSIFENLVIIDFLKNDLNIGKRGNFYFFRDSNGIEVDLIRDNGDSLDAIEIKSASTFKINMLKNLEKFKEFSSIETNLYVFYNGESKNISQDIQAKNFKDTF